jgi:hypothetical protein
VTAPQPAADASPLLDLARQYGDAREEYAEVLRTRSNEEGLDRYAASVNALFDRIATLAPTLPMPVLPAERALFHAAVAWRSSLVRVPLDTEPLIEAIEAAMAAQPDDTCGSCGRPNPPDGCAINCGDRMDDALAHRDSDLIAQVMAELGVDRPEDVLITIQKRAAAFRRVCESARLRKEQRDEARAEIEQLKATLEASLGRCRWPRESHTAAEIWRAFSDDDRRRLVNTAELAEALDREAGLNMDGGQS